MTEGMRDIQVEAYSGQRAAESPRVVYVNGKRYAVDAVTRTWRACRFNDGEMEDHFVVQLKDYGDCEIVHNHQWDRWTMKKVRASGAA